MLNALVLQVYAAVSQLVESPLCAEALSVLEAVLQSYNIYGGFQPDFMPSANLQDGGITYNVLRPYAAPSPQRPLPAQSSFKLRNTSGPLQQPWAGSAVPMPVNSTISNPVAADILPSR